MGPGFPLREILALPHRHDIVAKGDRTGTVEEFSGFFSFRIPRIREDYEKACVNSFCDLHVLCLSRIVMLRCLILLSGCALLNLEIELYYVFGVLPCVLCVFHVVPHYLCALYLFVFAAV